MAEIIFWTSLLWIVYTFIFYPFILLLLSLFKKEKEMSKNIQMPKVSLIIAAYNEESLIEKKIQNSLNLHYDSPIEIIIASDGSTDRTNEIVKEYSSIKLLEFERRGKAHALNNSILQATGEVLILTDANAILEKEAVKKLISHFSDPTVGCVCGELKLVNNHVKELESTENIYWKYETFLKRKESQISTTLGANGAIYAVRKDLCKLLPKGAINDDFILPMTILKSGLRTKYEPEAIAYEEYSNSMRNEFSRRVRIGSGNYASIGELISFLNPFKGFTSFAFWSHKLMRWFVPFFLIFLFISNLFLMDSSLYFFALTIQVSFYIIAFGGYFLKLLKINMKPISPVLYFVAMNLALIIGFIRFALRISSSKWEPERRNV
jgi:cellulose synthase/poly-beta-1,6-N-acetylglucosamine synthase-like glycosyltransferase